MANGERYPVVDYRCSVCKGILTIDDDTSKGAPSTCNRMAGAMALVRDRADGPMDIEVIYMYWVLRQ